MGSWLRWATSVGFLLAGLALALPALSIRVEDDEAPAIRVEITLSALDAAVNSPASGELATQDASGAWQAQEAVGRFGPGAGSDAQAAGVLTLTVLAAGVATFLLRGRIRAVTALGGAILAALTVTATVLWTMSAILDSKILQELLWDPDQPGPIEYRYGFWVVLGLLAALALANVRAAFVDESPADEAPRPVLPAASA
jgi:hypothetical protein